MHTSPENGEETVVRGSDRVVVSDLCMGQSEYEPKHLLPYTSGVADADPLRRC